MSGRILKKFGFHYHCWIDYLPPTWNYQNDFKYNLIAICIIFLRFNIISLLYGCWGIESKWCHNCCMCWFCCHHCKLTYEGDVRVSWDLHKHIRLSLNQIIQKNILEISYKVNIENDRARLHNLTLNDVMNQMEACSYYFQQLKAIAECFKSIQFNQEGWRSHISYAFSDLFYREDGLWPWKVGRYIGEAWEKKKHNLLLKNPLQKKDPLGQ